MFITVTAASDIFVGTSSPTTFDLKVFLLPEYLVNLEKKDSVYFKSHKKGFLLLTKFQFIF